jgi:hypothetical protein
MFNYKTLQDTHDFFQQELDLAKSNLEKAKKSEALNFSGFIEPNEDVFKFYENTDNLYIEDLFYNNIENEQELLEEIINWLAEASKDLVKFNRFCLEAKENGDLKESIKLTEILDELLTEKLCKKGRAYYDRRRAAGEKPSAYLSGRAVKVCKGLMEEEVDESLHSWFKTEDWVRIDTAGNITGPCGTMKKGHKTTRCLPRAKANSLTKAERAATSKKKTAANKQFVSNTKKAKVHLNK